MVGTGEVTGWPEVQFSVQWAALSSIQIRPCLAIYPHHTNKSTLIYFKTYNNILVTEQGTPS